MWMSKSSLVSIYVRLPNESRKEFDGYVWSNADTGVRDT